MSPWQLGNTSVRSGTRLRDGLIALRESGLEGSIRGAEGDVAWREALGEAGVVSLGEDATVSVGRKWRSALEKLGFIYGDKLGDKQHLVGQTDYITPNGERLIEAQSLPAQQECYLRAIAAYWIDPLDGSAAGTFSPLLQTIDLMQSVEEETGSSAISLLEFTGFVNAESGERPVEVLTRKLLDSRVARSSDFNVRRFDAVFVDELSRRSGLTSQTHRDYADMNLRYLKATGLFQARGRGIEFRDLTEITRRGLKDVMSPLPDPIAYWRRLANGETLPTDNRIEAKAALDLTIGAAKSRGLSVPAAPEDDIPRINILRHDLERAISLDDEQRFAREQRESVGEILEFFDLVQKRRVPDDSPFGSGERPAYLEWTVWRAFLALNHIINPISQSRRFPIDQQLLPTGTAPGGGPDMLFVFDDFVLLVEVTLTTSFRQEATEGHSVREHTFREMLKSHDKPVYCMFLAPELHQQTIETFRNPVYWHQEHASDGLPLSIVPLTLAQFRRLFLGVMESADRTPAPVKELLTRCRASAAAVDSPMHWENAMESHLNELLSSLTPTS